MKTTPTQLLIDEKQAAKLLSVSEKHLYNQRKQGVIPYVPLGTRILYDPEALRQWVSKHSRKGEPS